MESLYLILDREGTPLTHGVLETPPDAPTLQFRLPNEEELEDLTGLNEGAELELVGLDDTAPARRGLVTRRRGDRILVACTADLGPEARENLRIRTDFRSVIYPVSGSWQGRRTVWGYDLSCGGVAFYCAKPLEVGEVAEMVLVVTDEPLLVHFRVLRQLPSSDERPLYAARFVDLIQDEEAFIRKAVFNIQVGGHR